MVSSSLLPDGLKTPSCAKQDALVFENWKFWFQNMMFEILEGPILTLRQGRLDRSRDLQFQCCHQSFFDVRNALVSFLKSPEHAGNLYLFEDVALSLNIAIDFDNNKSIASGVTAALLSWTFTNEGKLEYDLPYDDHFNHHGDRNAVYYWKHRVGKGKRSTFISHFTSFAAGEEADPVRLHIGIEKDVCNNLTNYLVNNSKRKAPPPKLEPVPKPVPKPVTVSDSMNSGGESSPTKTSHYTIQVLKESSNKKQKTDESVEPP